MYRGCETVRSHAVNTVRADTQRAVGCRHVIAVCTTHANVGTLWRTLDGGAPALSFNFAQYRLDPIDPLSTRHRNPASENCEPSSLLRSPGSSMAAEQQPTQQQQHPGEPAEGKNQWLGTDAAHCKEMVDKATSRNPMVKFMLQKMEEVRRSGVQGRQGSTAAAATLAASAAAACTCLQARLLPAPALLPCSRAAVWARTLSRWRSAMQR